MNKKTLGDTEAFNNNWKERSESSYIHWTRKDPSNQIQLAFRRHWQTFKSLFEIEKGNVLEVGCGRGSLSAYFSDAGWDCTLLDISENVIKTAQDAFRKNKLNAKFDIGNCLELPYKSNKFDLVFSIGLLEHFEDVFPVIREQHRVLKPGGLFIGYVVPFMENNIQSDYIWFNEILKTLMEKKIDHGHQKHEVFRSDHLSDHYKPILKKLKFKNIQSDGIYSLPMISHSPEFPFTLLPNEAETVLVKTFNKMLFELGEKRKDKDGWRCKEGKGNAFLIWAKK